MPSSKLTDLEQKLEELGFSEESGTVKSLKMKMTPIELAMMMGGLNAEVFMEGLDDEEPEEDQADDDFDYGFFGFGATKEDRKAAAEIAKENHRIQVGGMKVRAKQELDDLSDQIVNCESNGFDWCGELRSKLISKQMTYERYKTEHARLNRAKVAKESKLSQRDDDARDPMTLDVKPTNYKYKIGQQVMVYETPSDSFSGEVISHRLDIKTNLKMYKVAGQDGHVGWYAEFRLQDNKDQNNI